MNLAAEPQFPTKWPFPPAPPARRALAFLLSPLRRGRRDSWTAAPTVAPGTFGRSVISPSATAAPDTAPLRPSVSSTASRTAPMPPLSSATSGAGTGAGDVTLRQMVVDILLVAMWGAMIPGLMWLGAAAGF